MPVQLYLDVHVDKAIHDQLHLRGVDVLRAQDNGASEMTDDELLHHATELGRIIFTQDIRFKVMAEAWQRHGKHIYGLLFGNQLGITIGTYVKDLELIAKATDPVEWVNVVEHLPYR
jgi:predicted nuclease of predicted toxin-antitoxin system